MKPRHWSKKWLEGAPEYVLGCLDQPNYCDRYTVLIGGSLHDPILDRDRKVAYIACNDMPTHPCYGVSMWGEFSRPFFAPQKCKVKWLDLPEHIRNHVMRRCEREY